MKKNFASSLFAQTKISSFVLLFLLQLALSGCPKENREVTIASSESEQVLFGLRDVGEALREKGVGYKFTSSRQARIIWKLQETTEIKPEGFVLKKEGEQVQLFATDEAGLLYGALELAEQIRLHGLEGVQETRQNPHMELRGTKFNIPLDVRTPSYSDASDAAQHNIPAMWDLSFWKAYLDQLARYRYNHVSLWNLHPFPSLVKVPEYPDIALNDVYRSTAPWKEEYHLHGTGLDAPEILANPEVLKRLTIEEKIAFWQKVMAYAKTRNIRFSIITWNVFISGTGGKYGITDAIENQTTRDYFRKSIKALFRTYPDLAGIGLTTGENMHGANFEAKEDWAYDTYARAMLELAKEMPQRHFTFNHRQHQAGAQEIIQKFKPLIDQPNIEFIFSYKYAKAHVYSAVDQPFHESFTKEIGDLKTVWELRNDDVYQFRWGAPGFVRDFIQHLPADVMKGMYYGSDQWVWGRDFLSKNAAAGPGQLEIEKHWYHWMLWGRLAYNPTLDDNRFREILRNRYPAVDAAALFSAWQHASMVYPITTGFHWGALDFQWYIEGCKSRAAPAHNETGFHDVNRFISQPTHPGSGNQTIPDFVQGGSNGENQSLTSPLEVAAKLHQEANQALQLLATLQAKEDKELAAILQDIRTMAHMGKYYAYKIAGATYLAQYRATKKKQHQEQAVKELTEALQHWKLYTNAALQQNKNPLWTNRVGYVDFAKITGWVAQDIEIAKGAE